MRTGLLVASPQMEDAFFARTVVLLCDYTEEGAIGIIVNRQTDVTRAEVLDQMGVPDGGGIADAVRWGGPVQPGAVFMTFVRQDLPVEICAVADVEDDDAEPAFAVTETLQVTPSKGIIEAVSAKTDNGGAFLTLGYAGWAPGQLDEEIQSGSWIFMDEDPTLIFSVDPEEQWEHCMATLGLERGMLWMNPIDE
jgi:putative transcriptional regulator